VIYGVSAALPRTPLFLAGLISATPGKQPVMPDTSADTEREPEAARLDRNLMELLNELRVSGTGIQVLLAFLLIVPFNSGYKRLGPFDKDVYFLSLICIAGAATCLIAPSIHHRLLFRHGQRPFIIGLANRLAILGMALLAVGLTAILVLIGNVVFGPGAAAAVGALGFCVLGGAWFVIPLLQRRHAPVDEGRHDSS
jgi:hypothetical protein